MLFDKFPYTNTHVLNLDWVLKKIGELENRVKELEARVAKLEGGA